jgi:predicted kinase
MSKHLILFRGLPGSGKTTLAKLLLNTLSDYSDETVSIAADDYFTDCFDEYHFDPNRIGDAHEWCYSQAESYMQAEFVAIGVHNTFTTESEMQPYFELAKHYGYQVHTVIVENRHGSENIHGVPPEKLQLFRDRFEVKL